MTDRFAVLAVCHANLCRSPLIERLLRRALEDRLGDGAVGFELASAGTDARAGLPMHPLAATVLREWGADDSEFHSTPLDPDVLASADLILTATREQRARCVSLAPATVRRVFTLRQFARLAGAVDASSLPDSSPAAR